MWEKLTEWLGLQPEKQQAPRGQISELTSQSSSADLETAAFNAKLAGICRNQEVVSAGRMHIVNLSAIKDRYGSKWLLVADKIAAMIQVLVRQRLGPSDFHYELGPNFHVLIFPTLSTEEAALKCAGIAHEIFANLFGEAFDRADIKIETAAVSVNGELVRSQIDPLSVVLDTFRRSVAAPSPTLSDGQRDSATGPRVETVPSAPPFAVGDPQKAPLNWVPIESQRREQQQTAAEGIEYQRQLYSLARLIGDSGKSFADWRQIMPPEARILFESADARTAAAAAAAENNAVTERPLPAVKPPKLVILAGLSAAEFSYEPIWFVPSRLITTYQARVMFRGDTGLVTIDGIVGAAVAPDLIAMADMLLLRRALSDLAKLVVDRKKALVSVPVHYPTLIDRMSEGRFLAALDELSAPLRQRIVLELIDLNAADWRRLPSLVARLKQRVRSVILRVSLDQPYSKELGVMKGDIIGGDLRDQNWSEERVIGKFPTFVENAKRLGLKTYVIGIESSSVATAAFYAGFDYMAGRAILEPSAAPHEVSPFDPINLFVKS